MRSMKNVLYTKNQLVEEVQKVFQLWKNEKPELRTIAHLSRETGVTDSALRRLLNQNSKISDDSIYKVLVHILGVSGYDNMLQSLGDFPESRKWFQRHFSYLKAAPALQEYKPSYIAEEITESASSYAVYKYICAHQDIGKNEILNQFGLRGEIELNKLIDKNLVQVLNEKLVVKDKKISITKDQAIGLLPKLMEFSLKREHIYNAVVLEIEGVSKEGYVEMMDAYETFLNNITQIIKNRPGGIPVVAAGFLDTFTCQPYFKGGSDETNI